jgi:predicted flap endonuclease-1-like 5' DNA nuclease
MAAKAPGTFDTLIQLASDFVTRQRGMWDHTAWQEFLSDLQQRGIGLTEEVHSYLGSVLEAFKRLYDATASVAGLEKAMAGVTTRSVGFIKQHQGVWGHNEWEEFIVSLRQGSGSVSDEANSYVGGVLEAMKTLYLTLPAQAVTATVAKATTKKTTPKLAASTAKAESKPLPNWEKTQPQAKPKEASPAASPKPAAAAQPAAAAKDDLTQISGIGPSFEKKLNQQGISTYAQLAKLSDAQIQKLEETLMKIPGRIKREDWVGQAKNLMQGKGGAKK